VTDLALAERVRASLAAVRARVDEAATAAGRDQAHVRIVAITKKLGPGFVRAAYAAGQRDFGENYVQEGVAKVAELAPEMPDATWHLVGRLQSNKASAAVRSFQLLHALDSISTAAAVARASLREDRVAEVLVQVRLGERKGGGEAARAGVEADAVEPFVREAASHDGLRVVGLMGVADPDLEARPQFAFLRKLSEHLAARWIDRAPMGELSMGMTGDFEDAVAEGATLVRIGTAIFGERPGA
jgi:PLP dependent protein